MILLVTGSRALWDAPRAKRWATRLILDAIGPEVSLVVAGDAIGPDTAAWKRAIDSDVPTERWGACGFVHTRAADGRLAAWAWKDDIAHDPLARNRAMVAHVAATYPLQSVRVLALLAGWSRTHGTHMTLGLARRAGLAVEEHTCPAEHGPRGGER